MTNWQIVVLCLAASVLASSILVVVFRRKGWNEAAELAGRFEKLAAAAMGGKDSGEALKIILDEILNPETETVASQRATAAALALVAQSVPPPPPAPKADAALPPAAGLLPLALVALLASQTSCTPEQAKTAASIATRIAGAACSLLSKDSKEARFACDVIDEASPVIGNLSTSESADFHRRTVAHVEVVVPVEQADAFAAANGGGK